MAKYVDEWKKLKPKAMPDDNLATALKELDRAKGLWDKAPNRESLMSLGGATKMAALASETALKWCTEKKEAKAQSWLQTNTVKFQAAAQQTTQLQRGFVTFMQEMQKRRPKVAVAFNSAANSRSNTQVVAKALEQTNEYHRWLNKEGSIYGGEEVALTDQALSRGELILKEMLEKLKEPEPADPTKLKGRAAWLDGKRKELAAVAKRLESPLTNNAKVHIKGGSIKL